MKRAALVCAALLLLSFSVPAQTALPDDGQVKNGVYLNRFFSFSFTYPKDWVLHDKSISDRQREGAQEGTYQLLSVTRQAGNPGLPAIFVAAERTAHLPGNPGAKEYLVNTFRPRNLMTGMQPVLNEPAQFSIAGLQFFRDDYSGEMNGISMKQSMFVTVKNGYAIAFLFAAHDEKSVSEIARAMNTILPLGRGAAKD